MAKFYGDIGYVQTVEIEPGIWDTIEDARPYCGDLLRNYHRWETGDHPNANLVLGHEVSILADPYALENFNAIKWVEVYGKKWRVTSATVDYPRITLSVGEVYNGG